MSKLSQMWTTDFIIGIMIFLVMIIVFYFYTLNIVPEYYITDKISDANTISSSLISEGFPTDWDHLNVIRIGLTNNNNILNETKVYEFSQIGYADTKSLFPAINDYYVFFKFKNGSLVTINGITGIGKPGTDPNNISSDELIQLTRFVSYKINNKVHLIKMVVYVW